MPELENAAAIALTAIRELDERITAATARLNQLRDSSLEASEDACDAAWDRLEQQVTTSFEKLADKKQLVHAFSTDVLGSMSGARDVLQAYQTAAGHLGEAISILSALRDHVDAARPQVATMLDGLQETASGLQEELAAAGIALQEAVQMARAVATEVTEALQGMQDEIEERGAAARRAIVDESQPAVEAKHIDWEAKLLEVTTKVEGAFTAAASHAEEVATFSLQTCEKAFNDTVEDLKDAASTIEEALTQFRAKVDEAAKESTTATEELEREVVETIDALGSASTSITGILEELARYTWSAP